MLVRQVNHDEFRVETAPPLIFGRKVGFKQATCGEDRAELYRIDVLLATSEHLEVLLDLVAGHKVHVQSLLLLDHVCLLFGHGHTAGALIGA